MDMVTTVIMVPWVYENVARVAKFDLFDKGRILNTMILVWWS